VNTLESNGKFTIYASSTPKTERLRVIGSAVTKVANSLHLETELSKKRKLLSIYVYYRGSEGDEIPVYCDWGKSWSENDVYRAIRNMMFVLSFHPHHSSLRMLRKEASISA
jgi:hypothetical protein